MQRRSLDHHIARLDCAGLIVGQWELDLAYEQDDNVEAHGAVHEAAFCVGRNVVIPHVGTACWRDEWDLGLQGGLVALEIVVAAERNG